MLEELTIRNYALIEELDVRFESGLNILSGETGAGKSIVVGALGLLLGDKGEVSAIRTGSAEAEVSGLLRVDRQPDALEWLKERELEPEDGTVLLRRVVRSSGKGSSFIQNSKVTRKDLQEFTSFLIDMHGQHEHQSLLSIDNHRRLLDQYAGNVDLAASLHSDFYQLSKMRQELEQLKQSERELLREKDLLEFSIQEIEAAQLKPGEEEELSQERSMLNQYEKLFELFQTSRNSIAENSGGALAGLREGMRSLRQVAEILPDMNDQASRMENTFYEVEDILQTVKGRQEDLTFSPTRLEECEERLQQIHKLEKKYGGSIDAILSYRETSKERLASMEHQEEQQEELAARIQQLEAQVVKQAKQLSSRRKAAAEELEKRIEEKLQSLGMKNSHFQISTTYRESKSGGHACGPHGYDRIEFQIAPNRGEEMRPLRDIASGGEISRIMLAIKSVFAETDQISALIFDEIDAGIGGEVARAVGEHLARLGSHKQILCITHLASIAVRADTHLKVVKYEQEGRTLTKVEAVEAAQRVEEIARMLSGDRNDETSRRHALELLERYHAEE
jgi:DNA repair protein RecN (Recombination protein N)